MSDRILSPEENSDGKFDIGRRVIPLGDRLFSSLWLARWPFATIRHRIVYKRLMVVGPISILIYTNHEYLRFIPRTAWQYDFMFYNKRFWLFNRSHNCAAVHRPRRYSIVLYRYAVCGSKVIDMGFSRISTLLQILLLRSY